MVFTNQHIKSHEFLVKLNKCIKTSIFTFVLFGVIPLPGCSKQDPFPSVKLPIYPSATDVHHKIDSPAKGAKSVVYFVQIDFPANELTEFYNKEMERMGFIKFFGCVGDRPCIVTLPT